MSNKRIPLEPDKTYHVYNHGNAKDSIFRSNENFMFFLKKYAEHIYPIADTFAYCLMPNHFHFLLRIKSEKELLPLLKPNPQSVLNPQGFENLAGFQPTDPQGLPNPQGFENLAGFQPTDPQGVPNPQGFENLAGFQPTDPQGLPNPQGVPNPQGFENLAGLKANLVGLNIYTDFTSQRFSNFFNAYAKAFNKMYNRKGSLFMNNFERKLVSDNEYFRELIHYIHYNPVHHGFVDDFRDWNHSSFESYFSKSKSRIKREEVIDMFDDIDNFETYHKKEIDERFIVEFD